MAVSSKITIRFTDSEARILRSQAIRQGVSLSAFARRQILHGSNSDAAGNEEIVSQILPVIEARLDLMDDKLQSIESEAQKSEERVSERLKKAVLMILQEIKK